MTSQIKVYTKVNQRKSLSIVNEDNFMETLRQTRQLAHSAKSTRVMSLQNNKRCYDQNDISISAPP